MFKNKKLIIFCLPKEWTDLTKQIYEAVEQHLSQNHVPYFTDLSNAEKSLLLERAARSLTSSDNGNKIIIKGFISREKSILQYSAI